MKKSILGGLFVAMSLSISAQSGTNSPYSQYGLGVLTDQSQGFNRGMNGVGLGLRMGDVVNTLNPASYSAVDSLTMIFDVGLSGQITNFKEGGKSLNARNSDFEYAVGQFRVMKGLGVSFGVLPYSNVGYEYEAKSYLNTEVGTITQTYSGSGGLHQLFLGAGWRVMKPLSVGFNVAYLWGTYNRSVVSSGSSTINSLTKKYEATVRNYNLSFGLQWDQPLSKGDHLTLGATMGLGHNLNADPSCSIINHNTATSVSDTTLHVVTNGLSLPMSYGVGAAWYHGEKWVLAADMTLQKWGSQDYPAYDDNTHTYTLRSGLLKDRTKVNVGFDYVPSAMSVKFLNRVHYRFGVGYATPYYIINRQDGPKEFSVSAGFGVPLWTVGWNRKGNMRPVLNISAQWAHSSAKDLITENTFRLNLGLTFNERWFAKWRID